MTDKLENWRPVFGFEGLYEVSDLGRVRSLDRIVSCKNRWGAVTAFRRCGRVLKPGPHQGGYLSINLYRTPEKRCTTVHILVAEAFLGPRPTGSEVCHGDGDKRNNLVDNLRYDTPAGNEYDKILHGTLLFGESHVSAKLLEANVLDIRRLRGVLKQQELADRYGCTFSNISAIQRRKSWRHV